MSAPGSSVFMVELLDAVAEAVASSGHDDVEVTTHRGLVSEVVDARTVAVVVPHEYYVLAPPEPESLRARTVGFGVEHLGTEEFETSVRHAAGLAGHFEISGDSVGELARRGIAAVHFPLGLVPSWDRRRQGRDRDVDVTYLGSADPRRLAILARAAPDLAGLRTELVIAPHEQMTASRPDFLAGRDKWSLLASSKVLVNLHRGHHDGPRVGARAPGDHQRLRGGHRAVGGPRAAATKRAPRRGRPAGRRPGRGRTGPGRASTSRSRRGSPRGLPDRAGPGRPGLVAGRRLPPDRRDRTCPGGRRRPPGRRAGLPPRGLAPGRRRRSLGLTWAAACAPGRATSETDLGRPPGGALHQAARRRPRPGHDGVHRVRAARGRGARAARWCVSAPGGGAQQAPRAQRRALPRGARRR